MQLINLIDRNKCAEKDKRAKNAFLMGNFLAASGIEIEISVQNIQLIIAIHELLMIINYYIKFIIRRKD